MSRQRITVIIPALNEEKALPNVLKNLPWDILHQVVVVDNGSTDRTAEIASQFGAKVVYEPKKGYGFACLAGIRIVEETDILIFLDGDHSDYPGDMVKLVEPITNDKVDLVIGSRIKGIYESGSLSLQQLLGNFVAVSLIRIFFGKQYSDLGPFRAIRWGALKCLNMNETTFGWTVEMQIKAIQRGLIVKEVPVRYRRRIGKSKISRTIKGTICAGAKITSTILRYAFGRSYKSIPPIILEFAKYPTSCRVKTRLAKEIGAENACRVYEHLAEKTHNQLLQLKKIGTAKIVLYSEGASPSKMLSWLKGADYSWSQPDGELGFKLEYGFGKAFELGSNKVAAVGTDSPSLTAEKIKHALDLLEQYDLVIVPAKDGGYVFIGMKGFQPQLFRKISWSTNAVLEQTLERAKQKSLSVAMLDYEMDIDTIDDLNNAKPLLKPNISVIMPVLNDKEQLEKTLTMFDQFVKVGSVEVIVCDGGSQDSIQDVIRQHSVNFLRNHSSRALRMNMGVNRSRGEWLWFLHADSHPDIDSVRKLLSYLSYAKPHWGFFRQSIRNNNIFFRFLEMGNELRGYLLKLPYGDQGLIMHRDIFFRVGGFENVPFLEDILISLKLAKICKPRMYIEKLNISSRHWEQKGPFLTTLRNLWIVFSLLILKRSPAELIKIYKTDENKAVSLVKKITERFAYET